MNRVIFYKLTLVCIKSLLVALTIVLTIYFVIGKIYTFSETENLVPQAKYISCMMIYAIGYIYSFIKIQILKNKYEKRGSE